MRGPRPYRRAAATIGVLAAAALSLPAQASADAAQTIIERCGHGESLSGFSQSAYAKALRKLSATTTEYSECEQLIRQAQRAAAGGAHGGGPSSGASSPTTPLAATPTEQRSLANAQHAPAEPVAEGGELVHPGVVHADVASALSSLPTPLLALLAFLLACLAFFGGRLLLARRARGGDLG